MNFIFLKPTHFETQVKSQFKYSLNYRMLILIVVKEQRTLEENSIGIIEISNTLNMYIKKDSH